MKLYIPPQITRLVIAFAIFISLFLLVRHLLIPDTFGQYGFYRGGSLTDNASYDIHYSGQKACIECHQDIEDMRVLDLHSEISCETCHGPGQKHVISGEQADIFKSSEREACGICHTSNAGRNKSIIVQIDMNTHNIGMRCIECHNPHQPWEMKE
jgi:hypothetical protein